MRKHGLKTLNKLYIGDSLEKIEGKIQFGPTQSTIMCKIIICKIFDTEIPHTRSWRCYQKTHEGNAERAGKPESKSGWSILLGDSNGWTQVAETHRGSGSCSECCLFAVIGVFTRVGAIYSGTCGTGRKQNTEPGCVGGLVAYWSDLRKKDKTELRG